MEFKARKSARTAPTGDTLQGRLTEAFNVANARATATAAAGAGAGGAAAAAGILTAVDEDPEGGEEAPVPQTFEYDTDAGEDEE